LKHFFFFYLSVSLRIKFKSSIKKLDNYFSWHPTHHLVDQFFGAFRIEAETNKLMAQKSPYCS
jgi:hypothetical protein